jgi:hypothetical protein
MFAHILSQKYDATPALYNLIVEGSRDVRLLHLAARVERELSGENLLHNLSIFHPGEGRAGGTYNITDMYITLRNIAEYELDANGNRKYFVFVLVDNDPQGRSLTKSLRAINSNIIEFRDIFRLYPTMPRVTNCHHQHIQQVLDRENSSCKGLDWEMEDYLSKRIWQIFIENECANDPSLCRPVIRGDKTHRNLTDIQKGHLHRLIHNSAQYEDVENIVGILRSLRQYLKIDPPVNEK